MAAGSVIYLGGSGFLRTRLGLATVPGCGPGIMIRPSPFGATTVTFPGLIRGIFGSKESEQQKNNKGITLQGYRVKERNATWRQRKKKHAPRAGKACHLTASNLEANFFGRNHPSLCESALHDVSEVPSRVALTDCIRRH